MQLGLGKCLGAGGEGMAGWIVGYGDPVEREPAGGAHLCGPRASRAGFPSVPPGAPRVRPRWREPGSCEAARLLLPLPPRLRGSRPPPAPPAAARPSKLGAQPPAPLARNLGAIGT